MNLNEIGIKCGTDKSTLLSGFLKYYEELFPEPEKVTAILEIGLLCGPNWKHSKSHYPSLKMWAEFFPNATIYGFDVKDIKSEDERIIIIKGNQAKIEDLEKLKSVLPMLDMIIDDGSHFAHDQRLSFMILNDKVKTNGFYVIEDLQSKRDNGTYASTLEVLKRWKINPDLRTEFDDELFGYEIDIKDGLTCKENMAILKKNKWITTRF